MQKNHTFISLFPFFIKSLLFLLFSFFLCRSLRYYGSPAVFAAAFIFDVLASCSLYFFLKIRNFKTLILLSCAVSLSLLLRISLFDHITLDYQDFLTKWVGFFRKNGGISALRYSVGNYNIPYLYFLSLFSYSSVKDLYLIKLLSVFFDLLTAFYAFRLCSLFSEKAAPFCFCTLLFLPTAVLNGAFWGQCDSIYVCFSLMSLYYILSKKPIRSMLALAAAFAFKLQAVFIFPLYFLFLLKKDLRIPHLFVFPAFYILLMLPAVLLGRPFIETLTLYFSQAGTVGQSLNYNSSSVFSLLPRTLSPNAAAAAVLSAFIFLLLLYLIFFRKALTESNLFLAGAIIVTAVPFLLPHMHDRYFYMADIIVTCLAFVRRRPAYPFLISFASLAGYLAYLCGRYVIPMKYGGAANLILIASMIFELLFSENRNKAAPNAPPKLI